MVRNRRTSDLWSPLDRWIVRASRHLAKGSLIPIREFEQLLKYEFKRHLDPTFDGLREFVKRLDPFFREEQKPLLRRSWKRWIQWKKLSEKNDRREVNHETRL